jgi:hypothetical protein
MIQAKFGLNWPNGFRENDQHSKIYLPCNFEVNLITHLGVIALFSLNFKILKLFVLYFKNYKRYMLSLIAKMCSMSRSTYPAIKF